jgi:hypothetical protein
MRLNNRILPLGIGHHGRHPTTEFFFQDKKQRRDISSLSVFWSCEKKEYDLVSEVL